MKLIHSLLFSSCLSLNVFAASSQLFSLRIIIEYEDWATEANPVLLSDIKTTLNGHSQIEEINDVKSRIEISSPIFRGISATITGHGFNVTQALVRSQIQGLKVVKKVSPIVQLRLLSPIRKNGGYAVPKHLMDIATSRSLHKHRQASTGFSTHVMTGVDKLHAEGIKGKGITIAIMDTGYDYKQDSLGNSIGAGNKVTFGHDWVGDDYTGDENSVAVEDGDPYADCSTHGTHVFGIAGANPTKFGVSGVAPEASFELHRVIGCLGSVGNDVAIKASIAIYERGVDIITASIGGPVFLPDDPWSTVAQRINQNGTYFQLAAGNDGSGYYTGTSPSTGIDVPAIGAVYNTETPYYLWHGNYTSGKNTTDLAWTPGFRIEFPSVFNLWTASSKEVDIINTGCVNYPANLTLPNFKKTAVLVGRASDNTCTEDDVLNFLTSIGVKYVLFYIQRPEDATDGPTFREARGNITGSGNLLSAAGSKLFADFQKDRKLKVSLGSVAAHKDSLFVQKNIVAGGRMTAYSSWGPTSDGRSFPTISAPGGHILSTFPKRLGGFGVDDGTSMAAPFVAGVAALVKQKHPSWGSAMIRNVIATTGNPMQYNDNSTNVHNFLAPVFQQGGGLVDAYRAVHTTTIVNVPAISFNDTVSLPKSLSFKVKNIGATAQTYKLTHIGAASGLGLDPNDLTTAATDDDHYVTNNLQAVYATLSINPTQLTIAPGQESTVTVSVLKVPALDSKLLPFYGGYIALNSTDGTQSVTVPYTGIGIPLTTVKIDLSGSVLGKLNSTGTDDVTPVPANTTFNITYLGPGKGFAGGFMPCIIADIRSPIPYRNFQFDLLKGDGSLFYNLGTGSSVQELSQYFYIDGTDENFRFVPPGQYKWRGSVLKINGNPKKATDWVTTTTAPFILRYTKESVGLPSS